MNTWVTADLHLGHTNIIKYCDRPFSDANHMDQVLINNWNKMVAAEDTVYHIGDFTLGSEWDAKQYISRLQGKIIFLPGSHDRWMKNLRPHIHDDPWPFIIEQPLIEVRHNNHWITMCHYAMRVWPKSFHGSLHIYGHSHGRMPPHGKSFDVGTDSHYFFPVNLNQVVTILSKMETPKE